MKGIDTKSGIVSPAIEFIGRNEFPDVKGIDTLQSPQLAPILARRNEFPEVKGIDTRSGLKFQFFYVT